MQNMAPVSSPPLSTEAVHGTGQKGMLAELDGGPPRPLTGNSAWSLLQRGIDLNPDGTALIVANQPVDHLKALVGPSVSSADCLTWSYTQLLHGAARLASVFEKHQILPTSTVLYLIPSCSEWALMVWVAALNCYTIAGLPQWLLKPDSEADLKRFLEILTPSSIVVESEVDIAKIDAARDKARQPFLGVCLGSFTKPRQGWMSFCDFAETCFADEEQPLKENITQDSLDRVALVVFTSGSSTGLSKCVQKTVRNLLATTTTQTRASDGTKPARVQTTAVVSLNTQTLALGMIYLCWHNAGTVVLPAGEFSAGATLHAIERYRVSVIGHMPDMIRQLPKSSNYTREKVKSLRAVCITGAVTTAAELEDLQQAFPEAAVCPMWGMAEAVGVLGWPISFPKHAPTHLGIASSGTAMPGARIRVVDRDGCIVRRGLPGEMHIGGDVVFKTYLDTVVAPELLYVDECGRWFKTGDIAVVDDAGQVYILGRAKDVVKSGDFLLFLATIENCLMKNYKDEVRVIGIPCSEGGDLPYAIYEKKDIGKDVALSDVASTVTSIGPGYRICGATNLGRLGMSTWPRSRIEKVSTIELRRAVISHLMSTDSRVQEASQSHI